MTSLPDFPVQFCFPQIQATSLCLQRLLTLVYALQSKSFVDLVRQLLQDLPEPNSWNGCKDYNISAYDIIVTSFRFIPIELKVFYLWLSFLWNEDPSFSLCNSFSFLYQYTVHEWYKIFHWSNSLEIMMYSRRDV